MAQPLEEFLVKIGVDASQASKINDVITTLDNLANNADNAVKEVADSLNHVSVASDKSMAKIEKGAEKASGGISKLKLVFAGLIAGAVLWGNRVVGAFNSAIENAELLSKQKNALFKVTESEIGQAKQYQLAMARTRLSIDAVTTRIALNLVPNLTRVADGFNNWLKVNKTLIANGLTLVIKFFGNIIQLIVNGIRFIGLIVEKTIGWKAAILLLAAAFAYFNRALLFSPIGIIIALIVGLLLIIDDLMVYLDGGKSAFGAFWEPLIKWVKKASDILKSFGTDWKQVLGGIGTVISVIAIDKKLDKWGVSFKSVSKIIKNEIGYLKGAFNALKTVILTNPILAIITAIALAAYLIYDNWDFLVGFFSSLWDKIKSFFSDGIKSILMYFGMSEEGATNTVNAIGDAFNSVIDFISSPFKAAWDLVKSLFGIWTNDSTSTVDKIGQSFSKVTDLVIKPFKAAKAWIVENFEKYLEGIKSLWSGFKSAIGFGDDESNASAMDKLNKQVSGVEKSSALAGIAGNQIVNTSNNNRTASTTVTVNQNIATPDPTAAGKMAVDGITQATNQAGALNKSAIGV